MLAAKAKGRLKSKHEQLVESLEGRLTDGQRWVLRELWEQLEFLEEEIARYDEQIQQQFRTVWRLETNSSAVDKLTKYIRVSYYQRYRASYPVDSSQLRYS